MNGLGKRHLLFAAAALWSCLWVPFGAAGAEDQLPPAVLIRMGAAGRPEVVPVYQPQSPDVVGGKGLLIWADRGRESWQVVPPRTGASQTPDALDMVSRFAGPARGGAGATGDVWTMPSVQLDQLIGQVVLRGEGFLTPAPGGYHLEPEITIRRQPRRDQPSVGARPEYPETTLELKQGGEVLLRIPVKENQAKIAWSEIPELPARFQEGLPPGEYTLRAENGSESATFVVEDAQLRQWVMEVPDELEQLLGTRQDPLYLQVAASHLLAQVDENGNPRPCTADALDLLEGAPAESLTSYLRQLREDVLANRQSPIDGDATGIPQVDAARKLILVGKWDAARKELEAPELSRTERSQALATLYRGVIAAESGQATERSAKALFLYAIEHLEGNPPDAYRARNNYANCLLGRTQDRLYNHAFQIASGVPYPLIRGLMHWRESLSQYAAAWALAKGLDPGQRAAVEVNVARLYALLADVIQTLDPPVAGARGFSAGEDAAADYARQLASAVLANEAASTDGMVRAAGHEILAQLAFRRGDAEECRRRAEQAMHEYLEAGALAGLESGHRTLGILDLREAEAGGNPAPAALTRQNALGHLRIAHFLSEFLREQIPADQIGLGRAGFFARRAYVNERLCELLITEGQHAEALRYAELAKARGLEDVLAVGVHNAAGRIAQPRGLAEILAGWPNNVAALEYFLGTEQAWLFVINSSGDVTTHVLKDAQGRPLASRDLVARLQSFLARTDHKADQMREQLEAGRGFDHTWQYELFDFYRQLLPDGVMDELRKVQTVLIVPHHILHYFPFAALVTEPDTTRRTINEMVMPRFLLDEAFNLCYAPSLSSWDLLREGPDRPIRQVTASGIVEFQRVQPLPGVEKDLANLKAAFGGMVQTVLSGEEACETRAKEILHRGGLLFLATHGQNFADQPLSSYLMFHADDRNDGYLTAGEIYGHDAAADLVVMSACYSGLADRSPLPGDDLFGLQRALLCAGARTVVSGVWDVYDGTGPELMREFFGQLVAGRPVPAALASSQRALLNRLRASSRVEPWLHPYFWAVYTTVGDDRTWLKAGGE